MKDKETKKETKKNKTENEPERNVEEEVELEEFYQKYINECRFTGCLRPETIRGYRAVFSLFQKVMPEVTSTELLTTSMLNEFFKRIQIRQRIVGKNTLKTGVKKSTIKTQWTKLNVFFKWLKENNHILENPLKGIKPPRVSYNDFKRLENNEVNQIYSAIIRSSRGALISRRDTLMISLLLYLGVRKGEFISLQIKDIDLIKKEITIRGETSKSGQTRIIPLHPTLLLHLKDYIEERNRHHLRTEYLLVSTTKDKGLSKDGLKHWVNRIIKISDVKFHLHQFRHTFACKITENGTPTASLQKLMGHADISMTAKYTRSLRAENMRRDIEMIAL